MAPGLLDEEIAGSRREDTNPQFQAALESNDCDACLHETHRQQPDASSSWHGV